jgi:outer membrane protein assembly factor BamB
MADRRAVRRWAVLAAVGAVTMTIPPPAHGDGATYQADPAHDGVVTGETLTPPLTKVWTTPATDEAEPVTVDGIVYGLSEIASDNHQDVGTEVVALKATDGTPVWTQDIAANGEFVAYDDGTVFVLGTDGELTALDAADGVVQWAAQLGPDSGQFNAPPTATGGLVYVNSATGELFAVDEATGSVTWSQPTLGGGTSAPTVAGSGVFVASKP